MNDTHKYYKGGPKKTDIRQLGAQRENRDICLDTIREFTGNPRLWVYVPEWVHTAKYYCATAEEINTAKFQGEIDLARKRKVM